MRPSLTELRSLIVCQCVYLQQRALFSHDVDSESLFCPQEVASYKPIYSSTSNALWYVYCNKY